MYSLGLFFLTFGLAFGLDAISRNKPQLIKFFKTLSKPFKMLFKMRKILIVALVAASFAACKKDKIKPCEPCDKACKEAIQKTFKEKLIMGKR